MMDLQVLNGVEGRIEWDSDAAKSAITAVVAPYRGLVVTDDNVKDMEKAQKELASMRRKIEDFRKDTKKKAEAPIKKFDQEVKGILKVIAGEEDPLKEQLDKYELQRINDVRKSIMEEAKQVAIHESLRDEYMFEFVIDPAWTNRTAKKAAVTQGIVAKVMDLKRTQDMDDERKRMDALRDKQVEMFCENYSAIYSLNTPITPQQVAYKVSGAVLTDIPGIIEDTARQQADVERNMMQTMAVAAEKDTAPEPAKEEQKPVNEPLGDPVGCTVIIKLIDVSEERLDCLKTHSVIGGMKYEIVEVR